MSDKPNRKSAGQPPVSAHPAFPVIVALWFAALLGIGSVVPPLAMFENAAIASGLPVVVPDEGGAFEQAPPGSSATYPTGDVAACVAAAELLLATPDLRTRATEAARRVFSEHDHFDALFDRYRELLAR